MALTIRRSRTDESDKLVSIWCRSVDATHHFLSSDYRIELEELVRSFLPEAPLWVAVTEQDEPIAFMLLTDEHMDALFVDPDVRGCGVGKWLVEHALMLAPRLTTNVNEQNEQAVGFYKKMGFKVTGRSEVDDLGKPYPLLHLAYTGE
ncbi:TPA: acetyltransferase [Citrobacter braakii]|uniref:Acetyltransferase n=1 Tax=Citrobacter murliniae TaxID=67829 RepID=A0ABY2PN21_9ENTR|nr:MULTISPECIES: acetyltransferase [Citrobacter]HEB0857282.1 acetyltransferase [Citrobacter freundii]KLV63912.1 acetyltransferase [Citrobacter sp. MGH106]MBJ9599858.1 acetyltransferase [Citrobacter werkmanii]MBJ9875434.1 acetyltransferase [Citrobacter werkmanii]MDM2927237.1 acetyltransferase [Citrobacter sp. Cm046]